MSVVCDGRKELPAGVSRDYSSYCGNYTYDGERLVTRGLLALGAGSDIAGSLRNLGHYCGVCGHKPSWGLISTRGHGPPGMRAAALVAGKRRTPV